MELADKLDIVQEFRDTIEARNSSVSNCVRPKWKRKTRAFKSYRTIPQEMELDCKYLYYTNNSETIK